MRLDGTPAVSVSCVWPFTADVGIRFTERRFSLFFSFGINIYNIRFTVQYNLFAGTIVAAGGDGQLDRLAEYQRDEQLGCFGLTEKLAVRSQAIQFHTYTIILH